MSSSNINYGTCNSMGDYNIVYGSNPEGSFKDIKISDNDIEVLKELANQMLIYRNEDVKALDMIKAGTILTELAEKSEQQDRLGKEESIINWKKFKESASCKVIESINLISSGITIGSFLKELLGV